MKWIYYTLALLFLCISPARAQIYHIREFKQLLSTENPLLLHKPLPLDPQNSLLNPRYLPLNSKSKEALFTEGIHQQNTHQASSCSAEKMHWKTLATYLEEGRAAQHELLAHILQKIKDLATEVFSLKEEVQLLNTHTNQFLRNTKLKCILAQLENSDTPSIHDPCISAQVSSQEDTSKFTFPQSRKEDANLNLDKGPISETTSVFFPHLNFFNSSELFSL